MSSPAEQLRRIFADALGRAFGPEVAQRDPLIRPAQDERFGDYQCNVAMGLAKDLRQKPREVAKAIVDHLEIAGPLGKVEIAGPGFINITLRPAWLADRLADVLADDRLAVEPVVPALRVVVDYGGPNIAKQMHVGHLRTTIIGDVIARVLEFLGHQVIRQNHVGDWGTQFGMLIAHLLDRFGDAAVRRGEFHIADLEVFYREAQERYQADEAFAARARAMVVGLQGGEPVVLEAWRALRAESLAHAQKIYDRLAVSLRPEDVRGESDYNASLPDVVRELLEEKKLAVEDQGAVCLFLAGFKTKEGGPLPLIIRKSDGGYLYATTDLAALRFRVRELRADRIIYLTDPRQTLHFQQVLAAAHAAGWDIHPQTGRPVLIEHITFGSVLGEDGRPLKTRTGENVKLADLLDEAVERAGAVVAEKNPDLSPEERRRIAEAVGVAAVKYADLSQGRTSDYIFSFSKMLAMEGNTAPYLMYAYARIKSIERKGGLGEGDRPTAAPRLDTPAELALGKKLLQFADVAADVAATLRPNILTNYLYELSQAFSVFYENCPVLKAETDELRMSRLALCDLVARTLRCGLGLLGISVLEQM